MTQDGMNISQSTALNMAHRENNRLGKLLASVLKPAPGKGLPWKN